MKPIVITPPFSSQTYNNQDVKSIICPIQSTTGAGSLTGTPYTYPAQFGSERTIRILNYGNNVGKNLTISGKVLPYGINTNLNESFALGDGTIGSGEVFESADAYTQLLSVTVDGAVTNVAVVLGSSSVIYIKTNYYSPTSYTSIAIKSSASTSLSSYTVEGVLGDIENSLSLNNATSNSPVLYYVSLISAGDATGQAVTVPSYTAFTAATNTNFYTPTPVDGFYVSFTGSGSTDIEYTIFVSQQGLK